MTAYGLYFIQYGVFSILLLIAGFLAYAALYTKEERIFLRNRVVRTLKEKKGQTEKIAKESEVTQLFKEANWTWFTNIRYLIVRLSVLVFFTIYLSLVTSISNVTMFLAFFILATEPVIKFSLIRLILSYRIKQVQYQRESELFSLFALLKTDLSVTKSEQINVYYLLHDTLPYFKAIQPVLRKFMSLWRKSPKEAGEVFETELGGDTAKFLGDFLSRLHELDRTNASQMLDEQNELFAHQRSEVIMQRVEVQRNMYFTFFFLSSFASVAWFMWFIYTTSMNSMDLL